MGSWVQHPQVLLFFLVFSACLHVWPSALASPIQVPDFTQCQLATDKSVTQPIVTTHPNCCLPIPSQTVVNFTFEAYASSTIRIRQAAQSVSAEYIAKYEQAYALMKALPDDDPRSFHTQANFHCAFCNFAYQQAGNASVPLQVHFSWLFLPWHRWYLYFHERILGSLIGDPSFALVFWNWDDQQTGGNVMPPMFVNTSSPLYDANRNQAHLPPTLVKLISNTTGNDSVIAAANLNAMYSSVVTATTAELFFGGVYVTGTDLTNSTVISAPLAGSIESGVHNSVHYWTGDPNATLNADMGTFSTAGRDPIFYAHHSNVDRLWDVWKSGLPDGPRADYSDADFLNAEFLFYDENALPVKVNVADGLNNSKLGIDYAEVPTDTYWINYNANTTSSGSAVLDARAMGISLIGGYPMNSTIPLHSRLAAIVRAPAKSSASASTEVLVIQGLRAKRDKFTTLRAFVNLPAADARTDATSAEFLGAFNIIPISGTKHLNLMTNVKFEIGDNLKRLGLLNEPEVVITLIVGGNPQPMTIEGLLIDYE